MEYTVTRIRQKEQEIWSVKQAMQVCPSLFPPGKLSGHEGPDCLLKTDLETIGIEVVELYQPKVGQFPPQVDEDFVAKVVRLAKEKYHEMGGDPVDMHVWPTTYDGTKRNRDLMVKSLTCFVKRHRRAGETVDFSKHHGITAKSGDRCRISTCEMCIDHCSDAPEGFSTGSITSPSIPSGKWWGASSVTETLPLGREHVESVIKNKTKKLPGYLTSADRVWLLLVLDLFPMSMSLQVPRSAETWGFSFEFDKVLLYSCEDARVYEFGRRPPMTAQNGLRTFV